MFARCRMLSGTAYDGLTAARVLRSEGLLPWQLCAAAAGEVFLHRRVAPSPALPAAASPTAPCCETLPPPRPPCRRSEREQEPEPHRPEPFQSSEASTRTASTGERGWASPAQVLPVKLLLRPTLFLK